MRYSLFTGLFFICASLSNDAFAACSDISTVASSSTMVVSFLDSRMATAANLASGAGRLTYDNSAGALRYCNGNEWVTIATAQILASDRTEVGSLPLGGGTASRLYTGYVTLTKGVYTVNMYNCLTASSTEHYVNTSGEAQSGTVWCGSTNSAFSFMGPYTSKNFICKVRSATASVRFYAWNPNGTISNTAGGCSNFEYVLIAN